MTRHSRVGPARIHHGSRSGNHGPARKIPLGFGPGRRLFPMFLHLALAHARGSSHCVADTASGTSSPGFDRSQGCHPMVRRDHLGPGTWNSKLPRPAFVSIKDAQG